MEKSHVSLERHVCPICGKEHDSGAILFDKRLRKSLEQHTVTGFGLCEEHKRLHDEGYVALVAIDEALSKREPNGNFKPENAYRTGQVAHVRREVAKRIFNVPIPDNLEFMFCEGNVITKLAGIPQEESK